MQENRIAPRRRVVQRHPGVYWQPRLGATPCPPYSVKYRDSTGRQVGPSGTYWSIQEAENALRILAGRKAQGRRVVHSREPFASFATTWLEDAGNPEGENPLNPRSVDLYARMLRLHVNPVIGRRPICEVDVEDIKLVIAAMKQKKLSSASIENAFKALRGPLNRAVARHLIPANPISLLERNERPKPSRKGYRILSSTEIERLFAACDTAEPAKAKLWSALVGVGLLAGLRVGETLGLIWDDIDWDRHVLRVERQYPQKWGSVPAEQLPPPKHGRRRAVRLSARLARILKELYLQSGRPDARTYVSTSSHGRVYTAEAVRKILAKLVASAGITATVEGQLHDVAPAEFTYHQLRHTFASALIHAGLSDFEVAVQLGHRDAATTRRYYVHLFNEVEQFERVGAALEEAFGA